MLRAVVTDDSPTARQLIVDILERDSEVVVVGQAKHGAEALELIRRLRPDVATMDLRMPTMDGFEATQQIMVEVPTPIIIVSASTSIQDTATSMQALRAGALTLLRKPPGPESPEHASAAKELVETVKAMADVKVVGRRKMIGAPSPPVGVEIPPVRSKLDRIIAIAASTGGPPILLRLLSELPADFGVPILVTQHISAGFTEGLAHWLDSTLNLRVKVAQAGEILQSGTVYVAPEDRHLGVATKRSVDVSDTQPMDGFRPSANYLFESAVNRFGDKTLGIILSGMGRDGVDGLKLIHHRGGRVLAQDEESCVVYGMPGAAVAAGIVDRQLNIERLCQEIRSFGIVE